MSIYNVEVIIIIFYFYFFKVVQKWFVWVIVKLVSLEQ